MSKINAVITGIGGYVPEDKLTNDELSQMMDTSDEWITTRVGIKERRILKDHSKGASFLGIMAVKDLFSKKNVNPEEIEMVICTTSTPDRIFPSTASIIAEETGIKNAYAYDIQAACTGFIVAYTSAANYIETGRYKKILIVSTEKMSASVDYTDRGTAPLFGDGAGCALVEATNEEVGFVDSIIRNDGSGFKHLHMKAGGSARPASHETVENREHFVYQEGTHVYKNAVWDMSEVSAEIMKKNNLSADDVTWLIPHQANLRIIDAVVKRTDIPYEKVIINIQKYGNTSSASIPICLWEWEKQFKKGDTIILTAFGAGFIWGALYMKWGY
ncbi:MAG: ketoacyl-ACP synthase III [Porphyromonadaceae bacterium]|nr:ketoacyl-ACP synthase III [Porphyromonadaceae bacterium]